MSKRTLFIDADDTLWENNIFFEEVVAGFLSLMEERGADRVVVNTIFRETEKRNISITGYGSQPFCQSLRETAAELQATDLDAWISEKEDWLVNHPIQPMKGVQEVLPLLSEIHHLILLTKGNPQEQEGKLRRSGFELFFNRKEYVPEKDVALYRSQLDKHNLSPEHVWMIGNSPRSDINPAKSVGISTVHIPYHTTWIHEVEEIIADGDTIVLDHFGELSSHFL